jgi:hypothetical protein
MSKKFETIWYIDPCGDSNANECVVGMLRGAGKTLPEQEECLGQECEDGKSRSLWRCPDHVFVSQFITQAQRFGYRFEIFHRKSKDGKIEAWPFTPYKPKKAAFPQARRVFNS